MSIGMALSRGTIVPTWADTVHSDAGMGPFDCKTRRQESHCRLGGIRGSLRLWYVHDTTRHTPNENHAPWGFPFHQVFGYTNGKEIRSINVDPP
jgi:hypothetical protein